MLLSPQIQHPFPSIPSATDLRVHRSTPPDPQGGPFRGVRFPRAATNGGATIAKSEDGEKCVVSGRECEFTFAFCWLFVGSLKPPGFPEALRILKVIEPEEGRGASTGPRVEASRNFWEGSGLKIDSCSTDVVWGHGGEPFHQPRAKAF
jgi:hypothetical protein